MTISACASLGGLRKCRSPAKGDHGAVRLQASGGDVLVGKRGRDADFRTDGTLSIWTVQGRKRIAYAVPSKLRPLFDRAARDRLGDRDRTWRAHARSGRPHAGSARAAGIHPVGIDLNETNALVAVDPDGRELFVSGKLVKVRNLRTSKARKRLQRTLASRKAEGKDTRSVRRPSNGMGGRAAIAPGRSRSRPPFNWSASPGRTRSWSSRIYPAPPSRNGGRSVAARFDAGCALAAGSDPHCRRAQGPRGRPAGGRGRSSLHQPDLFAVRPARGSKSVTGSPVDPVDSRRTPTSTRRSTCVSAIPCLGTVGRRHAAPKPGPRMRASRLPYLAVMTC